MSTRSREGYVQKIIDLYRTTPGTRGRIRKADRDLAQTMYQQGLSVGLVRAALLVAAARRAFRHPDAPTLQPIASLHYFLPVLRELQDLTIDPDYIEHLEARLAEINSDHADDHHQTT